MVNSEAIDMFQKFVLRHGALHIIRGNWVRSPWKHFCRLFLKVDRCDSTIGSGECKCGNSTWLKSVIVSEGLLAHPFSM